jgi:aspartyl-tRNA(Asn)/glutamyl-tRNA(Gln) amidotransferase subunit A
MADFTDDIFYATIGELNAKLVAKEFSAHELARAFTDRLQKLGPRYNALALSLRESALRKAKDVDDDFKRNRLRGPLQGIPFAVKDLLAVAKHPTTWGAKPYAGQVFDDDATVVKKLTKTGGVLTGKLSMVELAGGGNYRYPSASLQGPGLNPWDRSRWSGGSSSGSGSAVAAGLVTYALGSETSGSILTPSAFCGVTGLRPTYGLVSRTGAMALSWTMDKIGPMCRSAEDCGLVLQAISGKDSEDPGSAGKS